MNVGGFYRYQRKTSDGDRYKKYFITARISQVNVNTMEKIFEQWFELYLTKGLIVLELSGSYNVSNPGLCKKNEKTQQWGLRVANDIVLKKVHVYHEKMYADEKVVSKLRFVRSFTFQHHFKFSANITSETISHVPTKECKTRSFICKVNLNFLRSSRNFKGDKTLAMIVSSMNESALGFNRLRKGRLKTGFQTKKFRRL